MIYNKCQHLFFLSFCFDFILETTVVKTGEIRGLTLLFTPFFLLIGNKFVFSKITNI